MKDQEVKDLIKDLESVGLSEDPSTIEVGRDGVLEIAIGRNEKIETIYLLKRARYERIEVRNSNLCYLVLEKNCYCITCNSHDSAKRIAKRIQTFLNS